MRFGISLISWILPKILRIRRELVLSPLVVGRGASIALVAMCFPALRTRECTRVPSGVGRFSPRGPFHSFDPLRGRIVARKGQEKLRAHVTVRRSRHVLDGADIVILSKGARA